MGLAWLLLAGCTENELVEREDSEAPVGGDDSATDCAESETPYDGLDNDCDPATPDDDLDADGYPLAQDCADLDFAVNPAALEVCDGIDNNCDGQTDPSNAFGATTWYVDGDGDGWGGASLSACMQPSGTLATGGDCEDTVFEVNPGALEVCNSVDDDCDGEVDEDACAVGNYGGHRIDKDGKYYYALYNDRGFGILGQTDWYGSSDGASSPEGVTWNADQSVFYYNDLAGNVFAQTEPFGASSTKIGQFSLGQVGGGVVLEGFYYLGDYNGANIYRMDLSSGKTSLYASLGSSACKPYFGNNSMAIDTDGKVYANSSCGVVVYEPGTDAVMLNSLSNLTYALAMDADNELFTLDYSGKIMHVDKTSGAVLDSVTIGWAPSTTWTMAVDENGDFVVNYWGEQRIFSGKDGSVLKTFNASAYYPGTSKYYWYVTF